MNRNQLQKESRYWVDHHVITKEQRAQIMAYYPEKQGGSIFLTIASVFIGLGLLTFLILNWDQTPVLAKVTLMIGSLLLFSILGGWVFHTRSKSVGHSLILVTLLIFGSYLLLIGPIYGDLFSNGVSFLIWSLSAVGLYLLLRTYFLFVTMLGIITLSQVYSGIFYDEYHLGIGLLFILGSVVSLYRFKNQVSFVVFSLSYITQALVLVLSQEFPYYWLISLFLILYLVDDFVFKKGKIRFIKSLSIIAILALNMAQVFILSDNYKVEEPLFFFLVWAVLLVLAVIRSARSSTNYYWIDLILFVPVFKFGNGDLLSLVVLFIYSLSWLVAGYRQQIYRWVDKGTIVFLLSAMIAYFQLAWDSIDRSLFFIIGGGLLVIMSFILERKRRYLRRKVVA